MRRFVLLLGCVLPLGLCGQAAAEQDPPHTHYASSHLPADLGLKDAKPIARYRGFLRESVDLSHLMPPVRNQGDLGSDSCRNDAGHCLVTSR